VRDNNNGYLLDASTNTMVRDKNYTFICSALPTERCVTTLMNICCTALSMQWCTTSNNDDLQLHVSSNTMVRDKIDLYAVLLRFYIEIVAAA
jgi:hypothetical protein